MSLRILHFSDLHLVKDEPSMKTLLMHFIQSMDEIQKDGNIDLVVFTGDLVDKGGCSFGNIDAAFKEFEKVVITPIIEKLKLPKERFVFIPGNHDTENDAKKNIEKTGIIKTYSLNEKQQIIDLKNSTDKSIIEMLCSRTNVFKEFEKTYYSENLNGGYQYGDFESNFKFDINGCKVGVTSLNAIWLCGLGDDKELFLGIDQITNSQPFLSDCDIKIIASHVGYDLLTEAEGKYVKEAITHCYELNLSGHTHTLDDDFIALPKGDFCMNVTSAGTLCNNIHEVNENHKNSFQIIDILSKKEFVIR